MTVTSPSRLYSDLDVRAELDVPLGPQTWFGIGGRADLLIHPRSVDALATLARRCRRDGIPLRVLGSGANLLVDDDGVDGVVVKLDEGPFKGVDFNLEGRVERMRVHGGASMERLVQECARQGLRGIEPMSGIPASLGGAIRMNAGGKFGAIGDAVDAVAIVGLDGELRVHLRDEIRFGYRETSLPAGTVVWASLRVEPDDPIVCRNRVKEIFAYKKSTQPMSASSAGCMFRNPTMPDGRRESAGRLIDLAGLKGAREGGAFVSTEHGNFLAVDKGAATDDVRRLVERIQAEVAAKHGVELETEVVFWRRGEEA
ncbi:MAG: UDP-N-acetylmuramate dehydrogenase [Planctomycetota bacterium]